MSPDQQTIEENVVELLCRFPDGQIRIERDEEDGALSVSLWREGDNAWGGLSPRLDIEMQDEALHVAVAALVAARPGFVYDDDPIYDEALIAMAHEPEPDEGGAWEPEAW